MKPSSKTIFARRKIIREKWKDIPSGISLIRSVVSELSPRRIAVAFSGGLDSEAAVLLTLDAVADMHDHINVIIVYTNTTNEIPENLKFVDRFYAWLNKEYPWAKTVKLMPERRFGEFLFHSFETAVRMHLQGKWRKHNLKCCYYLKERPARKFYKEQKIDLVVTGERGDESRQRFLHILQFGPIDFLWGIRRLMPLWDWSRDDVINYLKNHEKKPPLNPIYDMGFTGTGCMLCPIKFLYTSKDLEAIRKYYPNAYRLGMKLVSEYEKRFLSNIDREIKKRKRTIYSEFKSLLLSFLDGKDDVLSQILNLLKQYPDKLWQFKWLIRNKYYVLSDKDRERIKILLDRIVSDILKTSDRILACDGIRNSLEFFIVALHADKIKRGQIILTHDHKNVLSYVNENTIAVIEFPKKPICDLLQKKYYITLENKIIPVYYFNVHRIHKIMQEISKNFNK